MALMVAEKQPRLFAAISSWAAMTDLKNWHSEMKNRGFSLYADSIERGLGGPTINAKIYDLHSPVSAASLLKKIPIDLNAGITDGHHGTVAVAHSLKMFNAVAAPKDRLSQVDYEKLTEGKKDLFLAPEQDESYGDKPVLYRKTSRNIRLTVFDGDHEMVPQAAIEWLSKQQR